MPEQDPQKTQKLIINADFKKQLLLLKSSANSELDIHISLDKMVSDKQYRLTVLNELDGLGSDALNALVIKLKHTPVYTKIAPPDVVNDLKSTIKPEAKTSRLSFLLVSLLFVIIITSFVGWKNGYLNIITPKTPLHFVESAESHLEETLSLSTESQRTSSPTDESLESHSVIDEPIEVIVIPTPIKKTLSLPSETRTVMLRLHGSNTVGENLAPALLEAYLATQSVTQMKWVQGESVVERELQYIQDEQVYAIELHAHGSSTGFAALAAEKADMSMSSRKIKAKEVEALRAENGDLSSAGQEYIIGLDGLAIIVNKRNPLTSISSDVLAKIFSGEINNWQAIGGDDLPINLYARDKNSGTWDTFNSLVLKANQKQLNESSLRFESSNALSERVSEDIAGIGFIGLPYVNQSKALAISESQESAVIYPTRFTVSTEDYALSRRLYMYAPLNASKMSREFSQFVISNSGQSVVERVGLVSQNIKLEEAYAVKNAPQTYNNYAEVASRLSVNFRFKSGSNEFDNKAKRDIDRLVEYLTTHRGRRIILMGFSDALGDPKMNLSLSLVRASKLEKELNAYGLNVTAIEGFGAKLPIASNKSVAGRSKNRRVEVWVF